MVRRLLRYRWFALAALAALALSACKLGSEFDSDPSYWAPNDIAGVPDASMNDFEPPIAGCDVEPVYDSALTQSQPDAQSHLAGQPCLEGCHEADGAARKTFSAAGTIFRAQGSRSLARSGAVHGIGGTTLSVDRCGNFYAIREALVTNVDRTQPFVQNPTLHRMDKSLYRVPRAGSCNQATCHDFSSRQRWGVYF